MATAGGLDLAGLDQADAAVLRLVRVVGDDRYDSAGELQYSGSLDPSRLTRGGWLQPEDRSPSALPVEALIRRPDPDELGPVARQLGVGGRTRPIGSHLGAELHPR